MRFRDSQRRLELSRGIEDHARTERARALNWGVWEVR